MEQAAVLILTASTLGQIGLSASMLILRSTTRQAYLPLAIFLIGTGIIISGPVLSHLAPDTQALFIAMSLPALLSLAPSLWLYVSGLSSETLWRLRPKHLWHMAPFFIALTVVSIGMCLPSDMQQALLVEGNEGAFEMGSDRQNTIAIITVTFAFMMLLGWVLQSAIYLFFCARRLSRYRARLKDLFASNESRELKWLSWLLCAVGSSWLLAVLTFLSDDVLPHVAINPIFASAVILLTVWSLSVWGLRQKPGFEELYTEMESDLELSETSAKTEPKYERSALDDEQSKRIAKKIRIAMEEDQLYLDASLSLQKLAKHISVTPNYISQTLNETIGMNFFDHINRYRIEAAKPMIIEGKETVLDIAMAVGFNARSSFYTAFKKETEQTPSAFRKHHEV